MIFLLVFGFLDSLRRGKREDIKEYKRRLGEYQEHEAETLVEIGVFYLERDETEKARDRFMEALENYRKAGDVEGEGYAHELIGDCYLAERNFEAAFENYENALKCYRVTKSSLKDGLIEKMKEVEMLKETLQGKSKIKERIHEDETSGVSKEDAIENINDLIQQFINLMDKYNSYRDICKDTKYLKDALASSKLINDWEDEGILHLIIGEILFRKGEYKQSLEHFSEAYNIFKGRDKKGEGISLLLTGVTSFILGRESGIYEILNKAMKILCEVSDKARKIAYSIIEATEAL